jgi:hypothetical protein
MANDSTTAVITGRRHCLDRTFKTIKKMGGSIFNDFEALIVLIATSLTRLHIFVSFINGLEVDLAWLLQANRN